MALLTINGQSINAGEGQTVLEAARDAGITIPTLCWHRDLSVDGSCRLCVWSKSKACVLRLRPARCRRLTDWPFKPKRRR